MLNSETESLPLMAVFFYRNAAILSFTVALTVLLLAKGHRVQSIKDILMIHRLLIICFILRDLLNYCIYGVLLV